MKFESVEKLDELINQIKSLGGFVARKKSKTSSTLSLIETLSNIPKNSIPSANFERVKSQILDRISIPATNTAVSKNFSVLEYLPRILKISASALASLLIFTSLTVGTAVAALQSGPGDAIYPFKKVVENVQLHLTADEGAKANLQIRFAQNRLAELEEVLERNDGSLSEEKVQRLVSETVKSIQKTTAAAVTANANTANPRIAIVNKIVDINNKLKTASIKTEGEIKLELEKAIAENKISQEEAIDNMERAGLKVEELPIDIEVADPVKAEGKLTAVTTTYINIGTARFLLTKDTKYVNITGEELSVDQVVLIEGEIIADKTYALKVTLQSPVKSEVKTETLETQTLDEAQ